MKVMRAPKVFVDEKSAKILLAALNRPLTALEICKITGVPVAHVFSRLRIMERKGLVAKVSYRYDARGRVIESPTVKDLVQKEVVRR